jgi:hypothetical protein
VAGMPSTADLAGSGNAGAAALAGEAASTARPVTFAGVVDWGSGRAGGRATTEVAGCGGFICLLQDPEGLLFLGSLLPAGFLLLVLAGMETG